MEGRVTQTSPRGNVQLSPRQFSLSKHEAQASSPKPPDLLNLTGLKQIKAYELFPFSLLSGVLALSVLPCLEHRQSWSG